MKTTLFSIAILAILVSNLSAGIMVKADFSGTWKLDVTRSEGVPEGMEQTMTVVQTGDVIKIETRVKTPDGDQNIPDSYMLNGKESDSTTQNVKSKRTSNWTPDGSGFEVMEKGDIETPDGLVAVERTRKWVLDASGKTLTIEIRVKTVQGEQRIKRLFVKQ